MDKKILLVDDEEDLLEVLSLSLVQYGFEVVTATSVETAIHEISHHKFSTIILDLNLKEGNSYPILQFIKTQSLLNKSTPVFLASGELNPPEILSTFIEAHLTKPFHVSELVMTLQSFNPGETKKEKKAA